MNQIRQSEQRGFRFAVPVMVAAAVATAFWVSAGQLDPPQGAIQATGPVTINGADVNNNLPYVISQPGSYILTSDITAPGGHTDHGIIIEVDNVTLDLNGFVLSGVAGSINGIMVDGSHRSIAIKNGTVRAWGEVGVEAFSAGNSRFENLRLANNTLVGLRANDGSTVTDCTAVQNGSGMVVDGCTVIGCAFALNTGNAISASGGSVITDCVARGNGAGFAANTGTLIDGCTASLNTGDGFHLIGNGTVTNSAALLNTGDGIHLALDGTVFNCTARLNGGDGIFAFRGATVSGCTVGSNTGDGIEVGNASHVMGNNCDLNGEDVGDGAGIHVTGRSNRIDGNNVTDNDRGIDVDDTGNLIVRNSAKDNSVDYDIVPGNSYGPIVLVGGVGDISTVPKADHPWANFSMVCPITWCLDADGDTYGDPAVTTLSCTQPSDYVSDCTDCDDANASIHPGASEVVGDGVDQDCDGADDCYQDMDNDTYGSLTVLTDNNLDCDDTSTPDTASANGDCNDGNASIYPGASEVVGDGVDQDCDSADDCYQDLDDDSYGTAIVVTDDNLDCDDSSTANTASNSGDCDDGDAGVYPGAPEFCDGRDNDCDLLVDDGACPNGTPCASPIICQSSNCRDGVCCNHPCAGLCEVCDLPGSVGGCRSVPLGEDPDDECPGPELCDGRGQCCRANGQSCSSPSQCCSGNCLLTMCVSS